MNVHTSKNSAWHQRAIALVYFLLGALVTAVFSGSLVKLAVHIPLAEILTTGMVIPTFTWGVQLGASGIGLSGERRQQYWNSLSQACLVGSIALLPAAGMNFLAANPPGWFSALNVLMSVALMGWILFHKSAAHQLPRCWPVSWCFTICINMALFLWASRHWWGE